jgi:7-cyano-7-deazaguanine synthase in queuosine biosynthesis
MPQDQGALVLFSGGQDSATCLAWALARFERVETLERIRRDWTYKAVANAL